jgi:hypothetical protein
MTLADQRFGDQLFIFFHAIQIQWGPWIRIRIRNLDPGPGGQKFLKKIEKLIIFIF